MTKDSTPSAEEELDAKLQLCDPLVQKYVAGVKADNLELQRQLAKHKKITMAAVFAILVVGIIIVVKGVFLALAGFPG